MPVVSTSRYSSSSSTLTGSYRPALSSSTSLDKSFFRTSSYSTSTLRNSYGDRTEYRSRLSEGDGNRERKNSLEYSRNSRAPSVTESDSGSRYRSERSESRGRDVSTTRSESGKTDRSKRGYISSAALAMSTAELYNKYSPANYIPLTQRLQLQQQNNEICRSKSISNDIGRPPTSDLARARKARTASTINERPEGRRSYKDSSPTPSYSKRNSMSNGVKDTNGNEVPTVSEIRRRFDSKMTVTKLPANDPKYSPKSSVEHYLTQLKDSENGYSKVPKEEKPVPVHLPSERNGVSKWEIGSASSKSNSNCDLSISKTISEPLSLTKPVTDKFMSASFTAKLPSERLASIKNQLDPNNPIGKILEKSTVIQVENGDYDHKRRVSPETKKDVNNDVECQVKAPNHTSNFASYIQISQPIASGSKLDEKSLKHNDLEDIDNDIDSPSATGFENKTFEHENYLKKRIEKSEDKEVDGVKSMETSTESTLSEPDYSPDTSYSRRKILDEDSDEKEVSGGRSTVSHSRRSSESEARAERERDVSRTPAVSDALSKYPTSATLTFGPRAGLNGLRNIGNTCFMNSVLQCLSNTRPLLEYMADDKYNEDINTTLSCMKGALIKAFASVIKELWTVGNRDCVVNTTSFKSQVQRFAPRFMGYSQQDAQEFLRYLLEGLHEEVNRVAVKPKPILTEIDDNLSDCDKAAEAWGRYVRAEESRVGDIFVGQLKSTLRCTHCLHDSVTFDPFWDLSLPLPSRTGTLKLQQCLQHFTKHEELDGDEKPTCSKCGVRRKCLKWFTVQKFPQVLVIHLKRFSPTERFRGKLSVLVEFPLTDLQMSAYSATARQATYRLYATSNHSGTTYSGHYTAYCKHPYSGDWYEYNDSRVTPINPRNVVSSEAYLLFYELQPNT